MNYSGVVLYIAQVPELPEVEVIRRQLAPRLLDRTVVEVETHPSPKFCSSRDAVGHRIGHITRSGKYLTGALDDTHELVLHLGMTGFLTVTNTRTPHPHERVAMHLDDDSWLVMRDARMFGRCAVVTRGDYANLPTLSRLGPDALSADFTPEHLRTGIRGGAVKARLLSQLIVAGLGNIYIDEALWIARVHPLSTELTRPAAQALHRSIQEVLTESLLRGGTTIRDYTNAAGQPGDNQRFLRCYGRKGLPCLRCRRPLCSRVIAGRTTTWCAQCQRRRIAHPDK